MKCTIASRNGLVTALLGVAFFGGAPAAAGAPKVCPKVDKAGNVVIPADKDLAGCNLDHAVLIGVDLSGADLDHANLDHVDLSGACLYKANLDHANLDHTTLDDANFSLATLTQANIDHANVTGTNLSGANLTGANTNHANLGAAVFNDVAACPGGPMCHPVPAFTENFSAATLSPDWIASGASSLPFIQAGQACSHTQAIALRCVSPASTERIEFDFQAGTAAGRESYAVIGGGPLNAPTALYLLGCDGGYGDTCGLEIDASANGHLVGPVVLPNVLVGVTYHIVATATAAGALTVSIYSGATLLQALSATVGPFTPSLAGFVVGRDANGTTCVDNYAYTSMP